MRLLLLCFSVFAMALSGSSAVPFKVEVREVRKAFDDGQHNAFSDLVVFKGAFYLACRSCPDGHGVSPRSSIVILSSKDGRDWKEQHRFSVAERDTRDPHFLVFGERLFVYTGTWFSGDAPIRNAADLEMNQHLGYAVATENGKDWSAPRLLEGTYGHYIWRAATDGAKAYLCGYRKTNLHGKGGISAPRESLLLESDDGWIWRKRAIMQERDGSETALHFEKDGTLFGVGRREGKGAQLLRSQPPYEKWQRDDLGEFVGGPMLARWGPRMVVGGRRITDAGPRTALYWLNGKTLTEFAQLPSGGDNSYPGLVAISASKALVSWYSSHEDGTSIYTAELTLEEDLAEFSEKKRRLIAEADKTLARQRHNGGWAKGTEDDDELQLLFERGDGDTTLDNGSTHRDLRVLAEAYAKTGLERFKHGALAGIEYLHDAQLDNGGFPQRYPLRSGYSRHITFNDGAMVGALRVLDDVARGKKPFEWCDERSRAAAVAARDEGIQCILKCQVKVDGTLTAWGQQHDAKTYQPAPARSFEPASLCSSESVGVVEFLMGLEDQSAAVITAIESAVAWLDGPAKLTGVKQVTDAEHGKRLIEDPDAEPLWARLYEIGSNKPIFGDRDGKIYYQLSDISKERREGYSWYVNSPADLLAEDYPEWRAKR